MRQYKEVKTKEIEKIICNKCGKEIDASNGMLLEDVLSVEKRWGYFSKKDNRLDAFDLCEQCYDEFVASFSVPIERRG